MKIRDKLYEYLGQSGCFTDTTSVEDRYNMVDDIIDMVRKSDHSNLVPPVQDNIRTWGCQDDNDRIEIRDSGFSKRRIISHEDFKKAVQAVAERCRVEYADYYLEAERFVGKTDMPITHTVVKIGGVFRYKEIEKD